MMFRRWFLYLIAVTGCLFLFMAYQGWLAWVLLMAVLWLPVLSLAVSLPAILSIRVQIGNSGTFCVGTPIVLRAKVSCRFPEPIYRCRVRVTRTITGQEALFQIGENLPTQNCGRLECQPDRCWVYDYLCLFRFPIRKTKAGSVTIRPNPAQLSLQRELDALQARSWRPKPGGGFAENHELRLFRPGDSLNQVHWKLSAKTGKLTVREAMEPAKGRILLTMELRGSDEELDQMLGHFYWLSNRLLEMGMHHELHALTADGVLTSKISSEQTMLQTLDQLLCASATTNDRVLPQPNWVTWHYHIGGGTNEA